MAEVLNDAGGVVNITGVVTYTNPFFNVGIGAPLVILEDQAGFVDRNENFLMPVESQTLGQITSDFMTSPFSYNISLPIEPQGSFRDVDQDDEQDIGVQVFAIAYWNNVFGDPYLEERDLGGGGWSGGYASTHISEEAETEREVVGGRFLVYSPDNQQGFPSGFGSDGLLFTKDDPIVILPQGFTVVNMDEEPFTFDRSQHQVIDLFEPEGAALADYSELSYTEAFDSLIDQMRDEYAFTEYKGIDWAALHTELRPQFEAADAQGNADLYRRALRDFAWSIPDGHVAGPFINEDFIDAAGGGIGMAIRELSDGRVLTNFLLERGPAEEAGIELGAEILAINGVTILDYVGNTVSIFGPFSTEHSRRLDQLLFATRFPIDKEVEIVYLNPGDGTSQTAKILSVPEFESLDFWFQDEERDGFELPVEYELLDVDLGYAQVFSFLDNDLLTVQLWERMLEAMIENEVPGLILDMRLNGGGRGFLADQMAAYFFDEPLVLGNSGTFDEDRGGFYFDPDDVDRFILPPEELRYHGDVVVLVGPDCGSACEFFSYAMTLQNRATVIGHYPTAGLGGGVEDVAMPEDVEFRITIARAVDPDGNIHIEGIGVVPDIMVPITEETIFSTGDPLLELAIIVLRGYVDEGETFIGDVKTGSLVPDLRIRYRLPLKEGEVISIVLDGSTEMVLGFYDEAGDFLGSREGQPASLEAFEVPLDFTLIIEIATADDAGADEFTLTVIDAGG
jgi:C-terminal processing protease CtpA/Prc